MNNIHDSEYLRTARLILHDGVLRPNRTGTDTLSVFATRNEYDLSFGFPLLTTKKVAWTAVVAELLWFLEGSSDERRLCEILHGTRDTSKRTIWTDNATAPYWIDRAKFPGDLGDVYGVQWRSWPTADGSHIDQIRQLVHTLKNDPFGRRHILSAWNVGALDNMALPPCHVMTQFYVTKLASGELALSCMLFQRSCDYFLGGPFNIASYSLLLMMIAQVCGYTPHKFVHVIGDAHLYDNHIEQIQLQLSRENQAFPSPAVHLNPAITDITGFSMSDIELDGYVSHGSIKGQVAV